jgi:hypothetical protein
MGVASFAVAGASAAGNSNFFLLTLSGTASAQWDHTGAPTTENGCSKTLRSEGIRSVRFRSKPTRVRIVDGRLVAVDVRGVGGRVTLGGSETTEITCPGGSGTAQIADCAQSARTFARAAVRLSSPARGRLAFGAVRGVRLTRSDCPDEIVPVLRAPAGPSPPSISLPLDKLTNPRTHTVTSRVSNHRKTPFAAPEQGTLEQSVAWTLTFKRVTAP